MAKQLQSFDTSKHKDVEALGKVIRSPSDHDTDARINVATHALTAVLVHKPPPDTFLQVLLKMEEQVVKPFKAQLDTFPKYIHHLFTETKRSMEALPQSKEVPESPMAFVKVPPSKSMP